MERNWLSCITSIFSPAVRCEQTLPDDRLDPTVVFISTYFFIEHRPDLTHNDVVGLCALIKTSAGICLSCIRNEANKFSSLRADLLCAMSFAPKWMCGFVCLPDGNICVHASVIIDGLAYSDKLQQVNVKKNSAINYELAAYTCVKVRSFDIWRVLTQRHIFQAPRFGKFNAE